MAKLLKTLRNHWKKSTVAALALAYGLNFAKTKYDILQMMQVYCEESKKYGDMPLRSGAKPRHVTVILNPACRDGKGPALYEKYASPILHLSGMKVSLIKTEYEGQAKAIMDIMDNTDAVLVASGDGTLLETVTGLCRRDDVNEATNRFPVGVLPIGKTNSFAKRLFWGDHLDEVRLLAESAMAVVKDNTRSLDVMSIEAGSGKPIYALSNLEWGAYRDINEKIPKYWYWGPLKSKMAYVIGSLKRGSSSNVSASLSYTPPCHGCNRCQTVQPIMTKEKSVGKRWWNAFIPKTGPPKNGAILKDFSKVINEQCGVWQTHDLLAVDLVLETVNTIPNCAKPQLQEPNALIIKCGPRDQSHTQFIGEGWKRNSELLRSEDAWSQIISAQEVKLEPRNLREEGENWFSIDNENHEARTVHIRLHPNKIRVFCKAGT